MMLGEWRARPGRVVVAVLAIAIGVALGLAVHLVNHSALDEFSRAVRTVNGEAELQVHAAAAAGFDEGLYPRLYRAPGIAAASPVVELSAVAGKGRTRFTLLGLDVLRAATVTPSLMGRPAGSPTGRAQDAAFDPEALFLSPAALSATGLALGAPIRLEAAGQAADFTIAGLLPAVGEDRKLGVIDIAAAQWRFGQLGRLQRIDLKLAPGAEIVTAQSQARRSDSLSRASPGFGR